MGPRTPGMSPQKVQQLVERTRQAALAFAEVQEELIRSVQHAGGSAIEVDRAYNINNAAKRLEISRTTVYALINRGQLKAIKYPGVQGYRITSEEIARFLKRCKLN